MLGSGIEAESVCTIVTDFIESLVIKVTTKAVFNLARFARAVLEQRESRLTDSTGRAVSAGMTVRQDRRARIAESSTVEEVLQSAIFAFQLRFIFFFS